MLRDTLFFSTDKLFLIWSKLYNKLVFFVLLKIDLIFICEQIIREQQNNDN